MQVQGMAAASPGLHTQATRPEAIRLTFFISCLNHEPRALQRLLHGPGAWQVPARACACDLHLGFTLSLHP